MIRILLWLALVLVAGIGFAWLADRPGEMVMTFQGYEYRVSLMVAATALAALFVALAVVWWIVGAVWNSPQTLRRHFRARRRDRGYQSLSTGLIAAGAGDAIAARKAQRQAASMLSSDQEPLIHLLDAQALSLEGDGEAARRKYESMVEDPETRLIGLRGLFLQAERAGDHDAARAIAERASDLAPQLDWASAPALAARIARGEFDSALALNAARPVAKAERSAADRRRAVILTAKAQALADEDRVAARAAASEANRLAPDLVPAAVMTAKAHFSADELKKGSRVIEEAWKRQTHPDLAEAYVTARPGDSTVDRLKRAERLAALAPSDIESRLAVARAALAASDFARARKEAEAALSIEPREGVCLLLADLAEAESKDQGRVRHWLARAVRAPADPVWIADGHASDRWAPFSPVTGRLDAFEWRQPARRIAGALIEPEPEPEVALIASAEEPAPPAAADAVIVVPEPEVAADLPLPLPDDPGAPAATKPQRRFRLF